MHFSCQTHTFTHVYANKCRLESFPGAFPFTPAKHCRAETRWFLQMYLCIIVIECARTTETVILRPRLSVYFLPLFQMHATCFHPEMKLQTIFEKWLTNSPSFLWELFWSETKVALYWPLQVKLCHCIVLITINESCLLIFYLQIFSFIQARLCSFTVTELWNTFGIKVLTVKYILLETCCDIWDNEYVWYKNIQQQGRLKLHIYN